MKKMTSMMVAMIVVMAGLRSKRQEPEGDNSIEFQQALVFFVSKTWLMNQDSSDVRTTIPTEKRVRR